METKALQPQYCAAIILNYNGAHDTIACLKAVYAMPDAPGRVIVVDNNSTDASVEDVRKAWKELASFAVINVAAGGVSPDASSSLDGLPSALLILPENGGYAAGNNAGLRLAMADPAFSAFWILNNDTEPAPGSLRALCDRMNGVYDAGFAGSTLVYAHDRNITQCAGGSGFNRWIGTSRAFYAGEDLSKVRSLPPGMVEPYLGDIRGASMLIRREVFSRVGFFREDFFLYLEETEFCIRARKAGIKLVWAPESIVFHKEGASTGARTASGNQVSVRPAWVDYLALRNRARLICEHYPHAIPFLCCSYAGVAVNRVRRGQSRRVPLVFRALMDGLRGRMGKPEQGGFPVPPGETK